ncbi:MAG: hypothetical protein H0X62_05655 [Bacteroidetes bacterium]|nr:hypothetical protein [Bacteroidota bacterium]
MKKKYLNLLFLPIIMMFGNVGFSQSQNGTEPISQMLAQEVITLEKAIKDHGFPNLKEFSNSEAGLASYQKAKVEWVEKNPVLYKRIQAKPENANAPVKNTPYRRNPNKN